MPSTVSLIPIDLRSSWSGGDRGHSALSLCSCLHKQILRSGRVVEVYLHYATREVHRSAVSMASSWPLSGVIAGCSSSLPPSFAASEGGTSSDDGVASVICSFPFVFPLFRAVGGEQTLPPRWWLAGLLRSAHSGHFSGAVQVLARWSDPLHL